MNVCLLAGVITLPLFIQPAIAETTSDQRRQLSGYIGKLSKKAIASGILERLRTNNRSSDIKRDNADNDENLKAQVEYWHNLALDTVAIDHTPNGEEGAPANQAGPTRTSRAMAMVHIAMFEAINAIDTDYQSFTGASYNETIDDDASKSAAAAQAAYLVLVSLYPDHEERLTQAYQEDILLIYDNEPRSQVNAGIDIGEFYGHAILANRSTDNSQIPEPYYGEGGAVADGNETYFGTPVNGGTSNIGEWKLDPNTPEYSGDYSVSLGGYWGAVTPFSLNSGDQFRAPVPPMPGEELYKVAYDEVAALGGAPDNQGIESTSTDQSRFIGNYWGYDGVPLIGVPPRIFNQIASQVGTDEIDDPLEYARYLALVNVGMADAAIAAWDSKFYYNYWRPVTGMREDVNGNEINNWNPIGISVINTEEPIRATPPFPAYPSGHSTFGAVVFEIMRTHFGDNTAFTFISDEFNGEGYDPFFPDIPRPLVPVRFESFTEAQLENGRSRIYNGVHWSFDDTAGQDMGVAIASNLLNENSAFQALNNSNDEFDNDRDRDRDVRGGRGNR